MSLLNFLQAKQPQFFPAIPRSFSILAALQLSALQLTNDLPKTSSLPHSHLFFLLPITEHSSLPIVGTHVFMGLIVWIMLQTLWLSLVHFPIMSYVFLCFYSVPEMIPGFMRLTFLNSLLSWLTKDISKPMGKIWVASGLCQPLVLRIRGGNERKGQLWWE